MRKLILIFVLFLSCKEEEVKKVVLSDKLQKIISGYIESNPSRGALKIKSKNGELNAESPVPSYHIYFDVKNNDTIMLIKLLPHLSEFNPITEKINEDGSGVISKINTDGFFLVDKRPVLIFDSLNYCKGIIDKKHLTLKIPDTLKFEIHKLNRHIKSSSEIYLISKGDFKKMSWEELHQ